MRVLVAIAVLSAGCSKKEQAKPAEPPPKPPEPATDSLEAFAAKIGSKVVARGTAELDEHPGPDRWAQLDDDEYGQYVIETADRAIVAQYEVDGRTQPWPGDPAGKAIVHQQGHRGGYERWELAVRGGELVVLRTESLEDERAGDKPERTDYADAAGVCVKPCPNANGKVFDVLRGGSLSDVIPPPDP
jgi:hypothetical protein